MKQWVELTDMEKRETIAKRLGWTKLPKHWNRPNGLSTWVTEIPDWPTNDGLAFTEVWPKVLNKDRLLSLDQVGSDSKGWEPRVVGFDLDPYEVYFRAIGDTWADAICRAAYELLPEVTEGEVGG